MNNVLPKSFSDKVDFTDDCWLWKASKSEHGYGIYTNKGKKVMAHRFSWVNSNGEIPNGLSVLHRCDVRSCVNPQHLFLGTQKDNVTDMIFKGRGNFFNIKKANVPLISLSQVSLNTRISPETDKMLREWQQITGKSLASIVDDAIISHLLIVNKELVMKHTKESEKE